MSGTAIRASLTVSAEIRAAAATAREDGARRRVREVTRRAATARSERGEQSERIELARARLAVLRETATRDEEVLHRLEGAQAALAAVRRDEDLRAAELALDAAEGAADLAVEREAVHREVVSRVAAALPDSLRLEAGSVRPVASGGIRLEALRPTGDRLAIELQVEPINGAGAVEFEVAHSGLQPRADLGDRCTVELVAVAQLVPHLAAVGLATGPLQRPDDVRAARRRTAAESRGEAR